MTGIRFNHPDFVPENCTACGNCYTVCPDTAIPGLVTEVGAALDTVVGRVRKSGVGLMMDIHIVVDGDIPVRRGHEIGHEVQRRLYRSDLGIHDAIIHVEPYEER